MATSINRRVQDGFITLFGLGIVVTGMTAIDETSRRYVVDAMHGEFPAIPHWLRFSTITKHIAEVLPVGDPSFVAFSVVALVLVVIMFRT